MSVTQLRNFVEKSGCGIAVAVVIGVLMVASMFNWQCRGNQAQQGNSAEAPKMPPIAMVGEYIIRPDQIEEAANRQGSGGPVQETTARGYQLVQEVDNGVRYNLAKKLGVKLTDDAIIKEQMSNLDAQLMMQKQTMMMQGQLKQGASDSEWETFFKSRTQKTIAEFKKEFEDKLREQLKKPEERMVLAATSGAIALKNKIAEGIKITDDQLKKSYDVFVVKKINFGSPNKAEDMAMPTAESALIRLKGGMNFNAAIAAYSKVKPADLKKAQEATERIQLRSLDQQPYLSQIKSLKPGQVSNIITGPGGVEIYQLVKLDSDLPKDFDKNKETLRKQYVDLLSSIQVENDVKKEKATGLIKFSSPAYDAVYQFMSSAANQDMDQDWSKGLKEKIQPILPIAKKAASEDTDHRRVASLLYFTIVDQLWGLAKKDEKIKKELEQDRVDSIEGMLAETESADARIALAEVLTARKDSGAAMHLLKAAEMNYGDDPVSEPRFTAMRDLSVKLNAQKLGTAEELAKIQKELDRWKEEKKKYDADQAAEKKRQLEEEKKKEAELKKQEVKPVERKDADKSKTPQPTGPTKTLPNGIKVTPMDGAPPSVVKSQKSRDQQKAKGK